MLKYLETIFYGFWQNKNIRNFRYKKDPMFCFYKKPVWMIWAWLFFWGTGVVIDQDGSLHGIQRSCGFDWFGWASDGLQCKDTQRKTKKNNTLRSNCKISPSKLIIKLLYGRLKSHENSPFLGDELGRIWRRWILRGRRGTFSTSGSICVAGVVLSVPP